MMKRRVIIVASILALAAIAAWLITQPNKSLEVAVLWTPPYPEFLRSEAKYNPIVQRRESIVYRIYYVWDDQLQALPWWIVTNSLDGQWRVIEAENSDNYSTRPEDNALFDDEWIEGGFHRVQRTRVQKFQHIAFGTDHAFFKEKNALRKIQTLIDIQDGFQRQGKDLFDAMSAYLDSHPEMWTFWPPSRDYFDEQFEQLRKEYLEENSETKRTSEQSASPDKK
jgi:hypothetical protein